MNAAASHTSQYLSSPNARLYYSLVSADPAAVWLVVMVATLVASAR